MADPVASAIEGAHVVNHRRDGTGELAGPRSAHHHAGGASRVDHGGLWLLLLLLLLLVMLLLLGRVRALLVLLGV